MNNKISRRDFLKLVSVTSTGLVLSACGMRVTEIPALTHVPSLTPSLTVTNTPIPNLTATNTSVPSPTATKALKYLRDFAEKIGFNIGVFLQGYGPLESYEPFTKIKEQEFNLGMVYLDMKFTQPKQNEFIFHFPDIDTSFAIKNNMKSLGHPLIWYDAVPDWVKNGNFSRNELISIMVDHITMIMEHYKGKMDAWVVVNEAYVQPTHDIFYQKIGPEYVEIAFQTARKVDPSTILIYNGYENHFSNGVYTKQTKEIVKRLKLKKLIDAVGLQMHLQGDKPPSKEDVINTMISYEIPVYVTEFDVNMKNVKGTQEERFSKQAQIYKDMLEAALDSGVCKDFIIFGVVDKLSVWEDLPWLQPSPNADPLLWDDNLQPKPAYYAMLESLQKRVQGG